MKNSKKYRFCIFSGRFDPPHVGHCITILQLSLQYHRVLVPVLDYTDRRSCSAAQAVRIFRTLFKLAGVWNVDFFTNSTHFGTISRRAIRGMCRRRKVDPDCTLYRAGNIDVLQHIDAIGFPVKYIRRAEDEFLTGTATREMIQRLGIQ